MSQDALPKSFRYYDPIVQICFEFVNDERKEYFHSKTMEKYRTLKMLPLERLKVKLFHNRTPTFTQLPKRKYEIDNHLNHNQVSSCVDLQRSKYLKIDD